MKKWITPLFLLASLSLPATAFAMCGNCDQCPHEKEGAQCDGKGPHGKGHGKGMGKGMGKMRKLTPEQREKLKALREQHRAQREAILKEGEAQPQEQKQ